MKKLTQKLQLCLLNDIDFVDLISELVRMSKLDICKGKKKKETRIYHKKGEIDNNVFL